MCGMDDTIWLSAREQRRLLEAREISARELMGWTYDQIERVNPTLNALVNLLPREAALTLADAADAATAAGAGAGALHGLPIAPKDAQDVTGFPTTFGFAPYRDRVATADSPLIARQRAAGALLIGKSNMPEFGLGSHTFNAVFGRTSNPYDTGRSAGGSSGGAATALASGMLTVTDGSDMGGSLRNPASFCNVVGLRPSIGRLPVEAGYGWLGRLATSGPMARTVADAAWLLSVQAGPHGADPLTLTEPGAAFRADLATNAAGLRIAVTEDLGRLPVDAEVRAVCRAAGDVFESLGAQVSEAHPDLSGAMDVFQTQRAAVLAATGRALDESLPDWRTHAKDTAVWNIEKGFELETAALLESEMRRTALYRRVARFFEDHDALVLPAAQVPPFDAELEWVPEIAGQTLDTYIDWMAVCCEISVTGLPAISVPGGFTEAGLPVGLQIVGPPRGDFQLLQIAHAFEQATRHGERRPDLDRLARG